MLTTTVHVPVSAAELAELRAEEARRNEMRERERLFRANRTAGKERPRTGGSLFVATARGIKTRGRAGLVFNENPAEVTIVDLNDDEVRAKQLAGAYIVNEYGAEQILADSNGKDTGLVVFASKPEQHAPAIAELSTEQLEAELAKRKAAPSMKGEDRITSTKKDDAKAKDEGKK
jgi:hypothetical protein